MKDGSMLESSHPKAAIQGYRPIQTYPLQRHRLDMKRRKQ